ncbi:MAG: hypothetical protein K2W95_28710 [Candidatus Obscuribacterales bacterium]|nr:hypothetical protein [Candidatus Obscuribacterales bacterium]
MSKIIHSSSASIPAWAFDQADDAVIAEARHSNPADRALAMLGEAPAGDLPTDEQLDALGVDRVTLARELRNGLNPKLFTRALTGGLNIDGFNNRPHRSDSDLSLNDLLEHLVEHARFSRRLRRPANRALQRHGVSI